MTETLPTATIRPKSLARDVEMPPSRVHDVNSPRPKDLAEDFLPKSAFTGKKLFVEKAAQNNGLQNTYRIRAGTPEYEVTGSAAAVQFLQELKAIDELRQISTAKAFTRGLKQSAKGTYRTGKETVRDPVSAVRKVPQGASRAIGYQSIPLIKTG